MTPATQPLILVTGGTGKTGRRIVHRLHERGVAVRSGSRSGSPRFDWDDPSTWPATLEGVSAAYIAYSPDLIIPGAVDTVSAFSAAAVQAGVGRLVLLAGRGEEEVIAAEAVVRSSGARWTIVRASWFAQNFTEDIFHEAVLAGEIALPAGGVAEPFVDVEDIADVAVAALIDEGHDSRTYDVTGPRLLTFEQVAHELSEAIGREIVFRDVSAAEYLAGALEQGVPAELAELLTDLFARVFDGRNAHVGEGVLEALGRPASDFADFARSAAALGAWDSPVAEVTR